MTAPAGSEWLGGAIPAVGVCGYGGPVPSTRAAHALDLLGVPIRLWRADGARRRRLLEAAGELTRASLQLAFVRRSRKVGLMGQPLAGATAAQTVPDGDQLREAVHIGRAVELASRRLPWHPMCLAQAVATRRLLDRAAIPSTVTLGARTDAGFDAHAWVTVGSQVVVGGGAGTFTPLARFASPPAGGA